MNIFLPLSDLSIVNDFRYHPVPSRKCSATRCSCKIFSEIRFNAPVVWEIQNAPVCIVQRWLGSVDCAVVEFKFPVLIKINYLSRHFSGFTCYAIAKIEIRKGVVFSWMLFSEINLQYTKIRNILNFMVCKWYQYRGYL